ncbi:MBL fold metallo-hydrolase [Pseudoruegeria sp. HB172150]|uniref:MBL fold metallo-hydrolase n=1 Tax=Pseudoruegeria sp. HB172150 TaxID=2721164 RepID=UPI0015537A45|nr:MBL fold metallo-hydrolase [Pseudoruegeria sp. HB172150]
MLRLALAALVATTAAATAQERRMSHCIAIADAAPGLQYLHKAAYSDPVPDFSVRITYIDHSMFLIQSPAGFSAITDYNGYIGSQDFVPDVVTMNHAHSSHWTSQPDERIPHVLKGWNDEGSGPVDHHVVLDDVLIRNVSTDIRSGFGGREDDGNSIFVFEVEGLCIGHMGHLHHEPSEEQYAALGRLDVLMIAVDGGMTIPVEVAARVVERLKSSVVIPMHWFGRGTLDRFLSNMSEAFDIRDEGQSDYIVSLRDLPSRPTVMVLQPRFLPVFEE